VKSGFSQQYISGLEKGQRNPTIISLYELAKTLGVSHVELVTGTEAGRRRREEGARRRPNVS